MSKISMRNVIFSKERKFTDADMVKISISDVAFYLKINVTDADMVGIQEFCVF